MNVESERFIEEQREIVKRIGELSRSSEKAGVGVRFSWNKYNGNVACNVVKYYLNRHLQVCGLKAVGPAFIKGLPTEFDILIVDKTAKAEEFTEAYDRESVRLIVEVKSHGTYSEGALERMKKTFETLDQNYGLRCVYLAIRESGKPKRGESKNWINITRELLKPYEVNVLSDSRTKELYPGQWQQFIENIKCSAERNTRANFI
jgi:hypothetical protein